MAKVLAPRPPVPPAVPRTDFGPKVKAHQRYYTSDGRQVPGVTTVLGGLAKPALIPWSNRLGLQGIDVSKYVDEAAEIGTLAHYMIESHLKGEVWVLDDFTPAQVRLAEVAFQSFMDWKARHVLEPVLVEAQLVSDRWLFGGTVDCLAVLDGVLTLLDFKTSSGIFDEHKFQAGAYLMLLKEAGHEMKAVRILRIGRDGSGLEEHSLTGAQVLTGWRIFKAALEIYQLRKELKA